MTQSLIAFLILQHRKCGDYLCVRHAGEAALGNGARAREYQGKADRAPPRAGAQGAAPLNPAGGAAALRPRRATAGDGAGLAKAQHGCLDTQRRSTTMLETRSQRHDHGAQPDFWSAVYGGRAIAILNHYGRLHVYLDHILQHNVVFAERPRCARVADPTH
jgi:hypothetical protein